MIEDVIDVIPIGLRQLRRKRGSAEVECRLVGRPGLDDAKIIDAPTEIHSVGHTIPGGAVEYRRLEIADGIVVRHNLAERVGGLLRQWRQRASGRSNAQKMTADIRASSRRRTRREKEK